MDNEAKRLYHEARELWTAGRKDEAEAAYRQAIETDPDYAYPYYDLGRLLDSVEGSQQEAVAHYQRFVELAGEDPRLAELVEQAVSRVAELQPLLDADARPATTPETPEDTVRCPYCREPIPASARACSNCGLWLDGGVAQRATFAAAPERRYFPAWAAGLLGALAVIIVLGALFILLLRSGRILWPFGATPPTFLRPSTVTPAAVVQPSTPISISATPTEEPVPPPTETSAAVSTQTPISEPEPTDTTVPTPPPTVDATEETAAPPGPTPSPIPPRVLVDGIYNVRTGPGLDYDIVGQVRSGDTLDITGSNEESTWWQVCCLGGEVVWIRADLAPVAGNVDTVPLAAEFLPELTATASVTETALSTPAAVTVLPSELPGRIAFPLFDPERGTYDVYVAKPDGSGLQQVLEEASQPALARDGGRLAFRRWRSDDRGVGVMDTYGGNQYRVTNFLEDALPSWSPDGLQVVFFSRREVDRNVRIYAVDSLPGSSDVELRREVQPVYGEYPTWMPNGAIVYRSTWPDTGLVIMNADGSGERLIFQDDTATAPAASPDSQTVAFMSKREGNWEVYRVDADGSGLLRLTSRGGIDGLPTWSPDGRYIAFVSERDGTWGIWAMTADGRGLGKLFDLPGSPDGRVLNEPDYSSQGWVEERISWEP